MSNKNKKEEFLKKYKAVPIFSMLPREYGPKKRAQLREFEKQVLDGNKLKKDDIER